MITRKIYEVYQKTLESVVSAHADLTKIVALRDFGSVREYSTSFAEHLQALRIPDQPSLEERYYGLFIHDVVNGLYVLCLITEANKQADMRASNVLHKIDDLIRDSQEYLIQNKDQPTSVHNILVRELITQFPNSTGLISVPLQDIDLQRSISTEPIVDEVAIKMAYALDPRLPYTNTPGALVRAIADNLLENAQKAVIEAAHKHNHNGKIGVKTFYDGKQIIMQIQDNGIGMSQEFMDEKLFHRKQSLFKTMSVGGHGEGLYYCRSILQDYGGDITVKSIADEGSLFQATMNLSKKNKE